MNILDRMIFTTLNPVTRNPAAGFGSGIVNSIFNDMTDIYTDVPVALSTPLLPTITGSGNYHYSRSVREAFCTLEDSVLIDNAMQKHWYDVVNNRTYSAGVTNYDLQAVNYNSAFLTTGTFIPPYHLIYAYLLENTRMAQIFEKLIFMYLHDEQLTKTTDAKSFQWIINTENLFFKDPADNDNRAITSYLRPSSEDMRRNAYKRLLGMDLSFGDIKNNKALYQHAEFANNSFIVLFESFLREIWQAYINARNTSGPNTTDIFNITDIAEKLQQMLMSRRSMQNNFNDYKYYNLSREEYSSFLNMAWFFEVISYNSYLVNYLRCAGNTPGERLINIGNKVGIPAHSKSEALFEMAPPMNALLRSIEIGDFNPANASIVSNIIASISSGGPAYDVAILNSLLLIINNWEKTTGHVIKTQETKVQGAVRIIGHGQKIKV